MFRADSSQPMQTVGGGNPVVAEVFGVAVRGYDFLACGKGFVHSGYVVLFKKIVRIKNKVAVKAVYAEIPTDALYQKLQGVAFCPVVRVKAFITHCAVIPCDFSSVVCAVVGGDKNGHFARIILPFNAVE